MESQVHTAMPRLRCLLHPAEPPHHICSSAAAWCLPHSWDHQLSSRGDIPGTARVKDVLTSRAGETAFKPAALQLPWASIPCCCQGSQPGDLHVVPRGLEAREHRRLFVAAEKSLPSQHDVDRAGQGAVGSGLPLCLVAILHTALRSMLISSSQPFLKSLTIFTLSKIPNFSIKLHLPSISLSYSLLLGLPATCYYVL